MTNISGQLDFGSLSLQWVTREDWDFEPRVETMEMYDGTTKFLYPPTNKAVRNVTYGGTWRGSRYLSNCIYNEFGKIQSIAINGSSIGEGIITDFSFSYHGIDKKGTYYDFSLTFTLEG